VDYRRYLIKMYISSPEAFEGEQMYFNPRYSPIVGQLGSVADVLAREPSELHPYIAPGPWQSEARPASQQMMLASSVDLNAPNFWWARMRHLPIEPHIKAASHFLLALLVVVCLATGVTIYWRLRNDTLS
jgi:hypothetical protein